MLDTGGQLLAKSAGGWLPTHDAGRQDGDDLLLVGRSADLVELPGGDRVSLTRIDAALRASPYIRSAATLPASDGGLVAVLDVDFESVARWANSTGISFRTPAALRESEDVLRMLDQEVTAVNAHLVSSGLPRITAVSLSQRPFAVGRELAPTWAVRRDRVGLPTMARPIADGTVDG
jgi:long-chain acyl-CoA synthetase